MTTTSNKWVKQQLSVIAAAERHYKTTGSFEAIHAQQQREADAINTMHACGHVPLDMVRNTTIGISDAWHAQYPQYKGHWDGAEWRLCQAKYDVTTKGGPAIRKGDVTIARAEVRMLFAGGPQYVTVHSLLTQTDTSIEASAVTWL